MCLFFLHQELEFVVICMDFRYEISDFHGAFSLNKGS